MEHLLPSVRETALLASEDRIAKLCGDSWIGYSRAGEAITQLEELFRCPKCVRMPNALIIGPTNNGKSMILERFRCRHLPHQSLNRKYEIVPVVIVQMPSDPTLNRFYSEMIGALGSPVTVYKSLVQCERVAIRLLELTQTRVLVIDELHNVLAGRIQKQREFLNVLRFIGNKLRISIVGPGPREAYLAIRTDDQLENRFTPIILPLWQDDQEFMRLLSSFQTMLPLRKPSNLLDPEIRMLILTQSEGTIGEIATFLTKAACVAIRSGKEYIDKETLLQVQYRSPTERRRTSESMLK